MTTKLRTNKSETPTDETPSMWQCFTTAVQFLTRIPIAGATPVSLEQYEAALRRGVVFFPLVGGIIGSFTAAIVLGAAQGLSPLVCALIAVGLEAGLTGAFHEDAFADTWDALGGGWTTDQVLEIMKDSRLGTYGTLGLVIGLGLRVAAIAALLPAGWPWTLASIVAASTIARLAIVGMMVTTSPINGRNSHAKDISGTQTWSTVFVSAAMTSPFWAIWVYLSPVVACATIVASLLVLMWFRCKILVRVGGTTGDLLGCSGYLVQLVILVGSTWTQSHA